jgi:hypothetical protein
MMRGKLSGELEGMGKEVAMAFQNISWQAS